MTKWGLYLLLLFTLINNSAVAEEPKRRILIMGDSLSAAYGINLEQGWVNLLQQELKRYPYWQVVNASVSGETSSGGKARLPALIAKHAPQIVVLELGGNDGLRGQPIKMLEKNLQFMIDESKNAGAEVLLIGMQIPPNYGLRYAMEFKNLYAKIAKKNQLAMVNFLLEGVASDPKLMQQDGIHPTAEAQSTIMKNVLPVLEKMLTTANEP